ncbi:MAG: PDDEXK nuclease domain-containing protein [bacterium]
MQTQQGRGDGVIDTLSHDLQIEFPGVKGFSARNLRRMKMIAYELSKQNKILPQLVAELPWGHISLIFEKLKSTEERIFYIRKTQENHRSRAILSENIDHAIYHKKSIQNNFQKILPPETIAQITRELKDEYNLSFLELEQEHTERQLENAMVDNIVQTLGQLGVNFAFMGRQFRIEVSEKEYFIDILFYHRKLKCMIAIELKTGEFLPQYAQQLNRYLHILDKQVKYESDNPSIGILICRSKDKILVEYALEIITQPMGVATYTYNTLPTEISDYLPSEDTIKKILDVTS